MMAIKTRFLPLNRNFASPYPVMAERTTVKNETLTDTKREFATFLMNIKLPSFPATAL
jgi:hypothetical protein